MGRGFVVGTLTLIVLYVVVQDGPSKKLGIAGNVAVELLKRGFSPDVAGIPDFSARGAARADAKLIDRTGGGASGGGGGGTPKFTSQPNNTGNPLITNGQFIGNYFSTKV